MDRLYSEFDAQVNNIPFRRRLQEVPRSSSAKKQKAAVENISIPKTQSQNTNELISSTSFAFSGSAGNATRQSVASERDIRVRENNRTIAEREKSKGRQLHEWHSIHHSAKYFQVGLHFRCGDKSFLMKGGYDAACVFDPANLDGNYLKTFSMGNPMEIAECANKVLKNHSLAITGRIRKEKPPSYLLSNAQYFMSGYCRWWRSKKDEASLRGLGFGDPGNCSWGREAHPSAHWRRSWSRGGA